MSTQLVVATVMCIAIFGVVAAMLGQDVLWLVSVLVNIVLIGAWWGMTS